MIINIILICVWTLYMLCEGGRESIFFHFSTFTTKPLKTNYHSLFLIQRTLVFGAFVLCIWLNTQSWILLLLIGFGLIFISPFFHDGMYYYMRNVIDEIYPKGFLDQTTDTTGSSAAWSSKYETAIARIIYLGIGLLLLVLSFILF